LTKGEGEFFSFSLLLHLTIFQIDETVKQYKKKFFFKKPVYETYLSNKF